MIDRKIIVYAEGQSQLDGIREVGKKFNVATMFTVGVFKPYMPYEIMFYWHDTRISMSFFFVDSIEYQDQIRAEDFIADPAFFLCMGVLEQ